MTMTLVACAAPVSTTSSERPTTGGGTTTSAGTTTRKVITTSPRRTAATQAAATDTYANYAELNSKRSKGTDYRIESKDTASSVAIIAIHGGGIEVGTTQLAKAITALGKYDYYSFIGLLPSGNSVLHITSVNFDEPTALKLVAKSNLSISLHGSKGTDKTTYLGGLDKALGERIQSSLTAAGFIVKPSPGRLNGSSPKNIVNRNEIGRGVQLEMTRGLRDSFLSSPAITKKYAAAVHEAILAHSSIR